MHQHALAVGMIALLACSAPGGATVPVPDGTPDGAPATAPPRTPVVTPPALSGPATLDRIPDVAERTVRSVVNIATEKTVAVDPQAMNPFGGLFGPFGRPGAPGMQGPQGMQPQERVQQGRGSGVIVGDNGLILTNNHVVGGADEIQVTLSDGRTFEADVVGTDEMSDLAVVRLQSPPKDLVALPYGDSTALRLGQPVLAIGNPFGIGQTVTMGIVSATGRTNLGIVDYEDFIQTDAAINPGNSGGALVNLDGELIGINTAIVSRSGGYQGIGFAIPTAMAQKIAEDLLDDGKVSRGYLGVAIQDLDDGLRAAMELDTEGGVLIADVTPGSAAEKAGFERGDVVVEFDGEGVANLNAFRMSVADAGAGESFKAVVLRDGKRKKLTGKLDERGGTAAVAPSTDADSSSLGLGLRPLSPELRARLDMPASVRGGVLVEEVEPSGPAARAGVRPGDVILEVNRRAVSDPGQVANALKASGDRVLMLVLREGATLFVVVSR